MAIVTRQFASFTETPSNVCVLQYDYDDVALRLTAVRCINNTSQACYGFAARVSDLSVNYEITFPANETTEIPIGNGVNNRLDITITERGITGVEYRLRYPA